MRMLKQRARSIAASLVFAWLLIPLKAELKFAQETIVLRPGKGVSQVNARFAFKNEGPKPIEIAEVLSSCGCTTTMLSKMLYEPSEAGEISAVINLDGRREVEVSTITVREKGTRAETTLVARVELPQLIAMSASIVSWTEDEVRTPKKIVLTGLDEDFQVENIETSRKDLVATTVVQTGKREYTLSVTPISHATEFREQVNLTIKSGSGQSRSYAIMARAIRGRNE